MKKRSKQYYESINSIIEDKNAGMSIAEIKLKYNLKGNSIYNWLKYYAEDKGSQHTDEFNQAVTEVLENQHKETKARDLQRENRLLLEQLRTQGSINNSLMSIKNSKGSLLVDQLVKERASLLTSLQQLSKANSQMVDYILGEL